MREEIPPGTLDMLILKTVSWRKPLHGFEIAEAIRATSGGVFVVEEGSLYPALQRLLVRGWVVGEWGRTPDNRRARYYHITAPGRRHLERSVEAYGRVTRAIAGILDPAPARA
ncbi:MAG TPA: PadR family transcriptional regulator [Gemmatimonadales bacterium]|jgi:transcriptional regulator